MMTKSDPFLTDGFLSEAEREVMMDHWRRARFPEEHARLRRLEVDVELVNNAGKILENYQRSTHNPSIVAEGLPPMPRVRGMPGPTPINRGAHSLSLAERARATTAMIQAQQGR
jgi:hypothetical protein